MKKWVDCCVCCNSRYYCYVKSSAPYPSLSVFKFIDYSINQKQQVILLLLFNVKSCVHYPSLSVFQFIDYSTNTQVQVLPSVFQFIDYSTNTQVQVLPVQARQV